MEKKLSKVEREIIDILKNNPGSYISPGKDSPGYRSGCIRDNTPGFSYLRAVPFRVSQSLLSLGLLVDKNGWLYLKV